MNRYRTERGQVMVLTTLVCASLLGMAALVLDLGSWMRAQRDLQAVADAAALAGAQALPEDPGTARALAAEYVTKNNGQTPTVEISNDTIRVHVNRDAPGVFARVFRIDSVNVEADAAARSANAGSARWVAPVVVNVNHELLQCLPLPCFGEDTTIELMHLHKPGSGNAAGAFALLNLDSATPGSAGAETVGDWMRRGWDQFMDIGVYRSVPSTMFNSSHFQEALADRVGDEVLFPIYKPPVTGGGSGARFDIVGWVGFRVMDSKVKGEGGTISGQFTRVVWEGIQVTSGGNPDFGVRVIELIE